MQMQELQREKQLSAVLVMAMLCVAVVLLSCFFLDQINAGNPITITNPEMTRFLMNLDEAVDLVMFAFEHGEPGDLFVQKADASTIW